MASEDSELTPLLDNSTDRDIEAPFSIDEPRNPVAQVHGDSIQPRCTTRPFLLIVRTGRIVTAHDLHPTKRV